MHHPACYYLLSLGRFGSTVSHTCLDGGRRGTALADEVKEHHKLRTVVNPLANRGGIVL